jgi:hypothetical protein
LGFFAVVTVGSCTWFQSDKRTGACPRFLILGGAEEVTKFRPGAGRDQTDVTFRAAVTDFNGTCEYDRDSVQVKLYVVFDLARGPANASGEVAFDYFVALPQFHPQPAGKQVFSVDARLQGDQRRVAYRDAIDLAIPLKDKQRGADFEVFLGFQLTAEEAEYNRSHRRR